MFFKSVEQRYLPSRNLEHSRLGEQGQVWCWRFPKKGTWGEQSDTFTHKGGLQLEPLVAQPWRCLTPPPTQPRPTITVVVAEETGYSMTRPLAAETTQLIWEELDLHPGRLPPQTQHPHTGLVTRYLLLVCYVLNSGGCLGAAVWDAHSLCTLTRCQRSTKPPRIPCRRLNRSHGSVRH